LWHSIWPPYGRSDAEREIAAHLALLEDDYVRKGLPAEAARLAARRALGGVETTRELYQSARKFMAIDDVRRDLVQAARTLLRTPAFSIVIILLLAVGIGANTAIFSLVYDTLIRPLPYANSDRIVAIQEGATANAVTFGNFAAWRERSHEFEALGAWLFRTVTLFDGSETTRLNALRATAAKTRTAMNALGTRVVRMAPPGSTLRN